MDHSKMLEGASIVGKKQASVTIHAVAAAGTQGKTPW